MTENLRTPGPMESDPAASVRTPHGVFRRVVLPLAVIGAIVAAIWWLESRDDGGFSPSGEEYGPIALPASLQTAGLNVGVEEGELAPDFFLAGLDGGEVRLSDLRGSPLVLNFWATWCRPCRKEIPQFVDANDRFRDDGLVIVGVNLQEGNSIARQYADDYGMDFPIAIDVDGEVGDAYRLLGLPTTFFIDRNGIIRSVYTGPFEERQRDTEVRGAIEQSELESRIIDLLDGGR